MTEGTSEGEEERQEEAHAGPDREAQQREKDTPERGSWVDSRSMVGASRHLGH